ncbi:MAG: uroporphyrinogen decarboxylase family protein [Deltaproteobacteria bacterium]|jgi:uroporphyrinogen decarboxylase|nr:uroporphyrinogen decarboxylase family protein [Deltaproteobacteria bacterium]
MNKDAMTPLERAKALREGGSADRMRCVPSISNTAARVLGVKVSELRSNGATLARATIATYRRFGFDSVRVFTDLYVQPEAMGSKVRVPFDETAHMDAPAISREEEIDTLVPHNPRKDGRLPVLLEATRRTLEAIGQEVPVSCGVEGPFTLAALLAGADNLSRWMLRKPESAHRLISIAFEACRDFADAVIDLGSVPSLTCAMSSSTVISPGHFRTFSQPYLKRLIEHVKSRGIGAVTLHICGKTAGIWQSMADTGAACLSIDNMAALDAAKNEVGKRVCLMGNIPPSEILLQGSAVDVRTAALKCVREAWDSPGGFILGSGCSLATETPFANIDAMLDTAREVGWPVRRELIPEAVS